MTKIRLQSDNDVSETLLLPLYARAQETQEPVPLVRDASAVALIEQIDFDFARTRMQSHDRVFTLMRLREFDRQVRDYLARHAHAVVIHIGCGLDTRFERVAQHNDTVTWYDLDLPEVIAVRRQLIAETERCHALACSVFEPSWLETVGMHASRPFLFLAEGVFPYFEEAQVRALFLTFMQRFPGAELVCDAMSPLMVSMNNLQLRYFRFSARLHWGLRHARDPEGWGAGIRLLDEWRYFDQPEPRLGAAQLMRYLPPLAKGSGIYHYRLGSGENESPG